MRALARILLGAIFVASAPNALQNSAEMTAPAEALGLPQPERMVQLHGIVNLLAGLALALGIRPRLAATALIANLLPTTFGGHRFWEEDGMEAMNDQIHFTKNVSLLGGLLLVLVSHDDGDADVAEELQELADELA